MFTFLIIENLILALIIYLMVESYGINLEQCKAFGRIALGIIEEFYEEAKTKSLTYVKSAYTATIKRFKR